MKHARSLAFGAVLAAGLSAVAFADGLTIGDKAPAIDISDWVKGDKVASFEPGKFYVVEFWATWCGPCKASMPHISELQAHYKDYNVTFIGVSDEPLDTVKPFLAKPEWDEKTHYTLATDPDKSVYKDYMVAADQHGIPTAFIVGAKGTIEWIGHPMSIDKVIDEVVAGKWDAQAFKVEFEAMRKLQTAMSGKNYQEALSIIDGLLAKGDRYAHLKYQKFTLLVGALNNPQAGYAVGRNVTKANWSNAEMLNSIAWFVVDDASVKTRDLAFALDTATRACELTKFEDGMILDTLARVYYEKHNLAKAIEYQTRAVEFTAEGAMKDQISATLKKYQDEAAGKSGG